MQVSYINVLMNTKNDKDNDQESKNPADDVIDLDATSEGTDSEDEEAEGILNDSDNSFIEDDDGMDSETRRELDAVIEEYGKSRLRLGPDLELNPKGNKIERPPDCIETREEYYAWFIKTKLADNMTLDEYIEYMRNKDNGNEPPKKKHKFSKKKKLDSRKRKRDEPENSETEEPDTDKKRKRRKRKQKKDNK